MTKEPGENPMQRLPPEQRLPDWRTTLPLAQSCPRCGARTRAGTPCRSPAMPNGRCRMHGGASTGPRTAAGLARIRRPARCMGCMGRRCGDAPACAALLAEARRWAEEY